MIDIPAKGQARHWTVWSVPCPKCGAPEGHYCRGCTVGDHFNAHRERWNIAPVKPTKFLVSMRMGGKPKKKVGTPGHVDHGQGWISGNCTAGRHWGCSSLQCSCNCHGLLKIS